MQNRTLREKLPIKTECLRPQIPINIKRDKELAQTKTKKYYDRNARDLPSLSKNQSVLVKTGRIWKPGKVVDKHEKPRSYIVQTESSFIRRNRKDLRPSMNAPPVFMEEQ
ncbi:hypothetical protein TcasGA2_TC012968 [Tribolium castaneum]|nr:hypothetical protein TcasGA2_TC012968 [Tribolium castaneum]